jgi:transposase, IS30 family
LKEREILFALLWQKAPLRTIGKVLKRSHTTLSREVRRNTEYARLYVACKAQDYADFRLHQQRQQARLKSPEIYAYVWEKLHLRWSPEIIAGRLAIDLPGRSIHHESIYRYIYRNGLGLRLWQYLTHARKRRMKRHGRRIKPAGKIPDAVSIDLRPLEVDKREIAGHWETDNLLGKQTDKTAISTTVERVTRYTLLTKVAKTAEAKKEALIGRLLFFPKQLQQTITTDNGAENASHKAVTTALSMPVYFCHAYHSWEKGSVENMNGRIRRYIPKGKSIDSLTAEEVAVVEQQLNSTPRKCLEFLTPEEALVLENGTLAMQRKLWHEQAVDWTGTHPL